LNSPPVAAWVASIAACVPALANAAPPMVVARPAGVKAAMPDSARGMSLTWKPGLIAYSLPSIEERSRKLPLSSWRACTPGKFD
jgi:hypothetical protein